MSDAAIAASRLPDLPTAGYATRTERALTDVMQEIIRGLERDRLLLLQIVIDGKTRWRTVFTKAYKFLKADTELADAVFGYLCLLAGPDPYAQKALVEQAIHQNAVRQWDRRQSTLLKFGKDNRALMDAIRRERKRTKH